MCLQGVRQDSQEAANKDPKATLKKKTKNPALGNTNHPHPKPCLSVPYLHPLIYTVPPYSQTSFAPETRQAGPAIQHSTQKDIRPCTSSPVPQIGWPSTSTTSDLHSQQPRSTKPEGREEDVLKGAVRWGVGRERTKTESVS